MLKLPMLVQCKTPQGRSEDQNMSEHEWIMCDRLLLILVHVLVFSTKLFINAQIRVLVR